MTGDVYNTKASRPCFFRNRSTRLRRFARREGRDARATRTHAVFGGSMSVSQTSQPAVVNYSREKHSVELREVPRPKIGPTDVLLQVSAVGVCGSDLHQWTSDHSWPVNYPVILGHEFAGVIAETGAEVVG